MDDDATLLALSRHVLGGPREAGRASYQVVLRVCPECVGGVQPGDGALVPVSSNVVEMARCDEQAVPTILPSPSLAANDVTERATAHMGRAAPRARQKVPPAIRRAVVQRDEHRCRVPGCKNATYLDLHHLVLRSEGGRNDIANLITLCGPHHRAVHRGELVVAGDSSERLTFQDNDGSAYGRVSAPAALDVHARVFAGLRGLGFREGEVRAALTPLDRGSEASLTAEGLLREALLRLTAYRVQG